MQLYRSKPINHGFIVLCPDRNLSRFRSTVNMIRKRFESSCMGVVDGDMLPEQLLEFNLACPVSQGRNSITSLINAGMNNSCFDWNIIIMSGVWMRRNIEKKYSYFVESTKDVVYSIIQGKYHWDECCLNGIMIHRDTWREVGDFCEQSPLPVCKLLWATRAMEKGVNFKAVIGTQIA